MAKDLIWKISGSRHFLEWKLRSWKGASTLGGPVGAKEFGMVEDCLGGAFLTNTD
jgi:hypothetical protein